MPIIMVYAPITCTYGSNGPGLCKRIRGGGFSQVTRPPTAVSPQPFWTSNSRL